jgi:hypothetical protein
MRKFILRFSLLNFFLLILITSAAYAESDITELYDENTEFSITGTVLESVQEPGKWMRRGGGGPVILKIKTKQRIYNIITAPQWFLTQYNIVFVPGSELQITGSKFFGSDGALYLLARTIRDTADGKTIFLRDASCRPLWGGRGMHRKGPP